MGGAMQTRGGSRFRRRIYTPMAEINVTPLVDVMLVLLIIFMVAAPLMNVGVSVDLPKTTADPIQGQDEPLVVSVKAKGEVYLGDTEHTVDELITKLKAVQAEKPDQRIFVRGDKAVDYGRVMEVLGALRAAGFTKAGLVGDMAPGGVAPPAGKSGAPGPAPAAPGAKGPAASGQPARKN
ncbi:MAG: protein TolR [Alphaproteobacteria bacterium]|nr:protein TolR [Alphaproteobacteria bacterium]